MRTLDWTLIDIIRIGFTSRPWSDGEAPPEKPITLLISVQPDTTTWETGIEAAMACRAILRRFNIFDVEVEVMEACCEALNTETPNPHLKTEPVTGERTDANLQLSELIGTSIASIESPSVEGTKGFYVRLEDHPERLLAVTCQHVLFGRNAKNEDYHHIETDRKVVIQPGDGTWTDTIELLQVCIDRCQARIDCATRLLATNSSDVLGATSIEATSLNTEKAASEAWLSQYHEIQELGKRAIGHVLFSPRYSVSNSGPARPERLRDWALIELDQAKHETPFSAQKNAIVGGHTADILFDKARAKELSRDVRRKYPNKLQIDNNMGTIVLADKCVPDKELRDPEEESMSLDEPAKLVAKFGRSSGLTAGVRNEVKSVKRTIDGAHELISDEWCTMGAKTMGDNSRLPFSTKGDSGSCIFDMEGRIAGLLTSGKGPGGAYDLAYVTPMEWLLHDIRSFGYQVYLA
ncbi:hypothetical protein FLONG3_10280 [Fusarium longipes]|uniref:Uncharacterized protein n=1 Tax=Fusarium longipes TaxID=694270 RepID=A0A395RQH2_9HYPO|nr:hypothetical protein FLONG3_10280 [Fusarium longipes]